MAIRRREKPLTPAEAIGLAKKELFPYWFGSEPLLAGARNGNEVRAYPLDSVISERPWLLMIMDPMAISSRDLFNYALSWRSRYEQQKLSVMVVLKLDFSFSKDPEWGRRIFSTLGDNVLITVMDNGGLLQQAFQVNELPRVILLHQNRIAFVKSGKDWFNGTEQELQKFFRQTDPGLPLFEPMPAPPEPVIDLASLDVGQPEAQKLLTFSGQWKMEGDHAVTQDPKASLLVKSTGKRVGLIAQALTGDSEIIVEMPREFTREVLFDQDLHMDPKVLGNPLIDPLQKRRASFQASHPRLFSLFRGLPTSHRDLKLLFPTAERSAVAIYGLRFGD